MSNAKQTDKSKFVPEENYQVTNKKRKISDSQSLETPQRVRDTFMQQIESRQQCTDLMLNNLSNILTKQDANYAVMKENQVKFEKLTGALWKCIQNSNAAQKQKLQSMWEIHATFKKGCEELNAIEKAQNENLTEFVQVDLKNFEQKLIADTKQRGWGK